MKANPLIKNLKRQAAGIASSAVFSAGAFGGPTVLDSAVSPINGHVYYLLANSDWADAERSAVALGGHLATILYLRSKN